MSVTQNLGKVSITPKGQWSSLIQYEKLDVVSDQGCAYISKSQVPAGTSLQNQTYWQQIASIGPQGSAATISVGTVTTLESGNPATVINSGTSQQAVFDFGIPKGSDANVTSSNIIQALGYTPADSEDIHGQFTNIEINTLSGNVFSIERSKYLSQDYNYQSILLYFDADNTSVSYAPRIQLSINGLVVAENMQPLGTQSNSKGYIYVWFKGNMIQVHSANQSFYNASYYDLNKSGITTRSNMLFPVNDAKIHSFKLQIAQNTPFASGSKMYIYVQR